MTVDEAIEEIEMLNWGGISFKTEQVQELIKQLQEEVEGLKNCCAFCERYENGACTDNGKRYSRKFGCGRFKEATA